MSNKIVTKKCTKCNEVKSISDFGKRKRMKSGIHEWCKVCVNKSNTDRGRTKKGLIVITYLRQISRSKKRDMPLPSYTKDDLVYWLFNQDLFHTLHKNWKGSGYDRDLAPSVDRKDDYKSYTMDNIQLMTWKENLLKGARDRVLGRNNKKSKAVIQIDFDGNKVQEYYSMAEASRQTKIGDSHISKACNGKRNHAGGYKWKFK